MGNRASLKSLALVAGLVLLAGGLASNAVAGPPDPGLSDVTAIQAATQARESGEAVPVTAEYTKTTQVFANPDGTLTAEIASGPVQIPSEEAATGWEDIDTTLADTGGIVEPEAAAAVIEFSDGGDAELASLASGTRQFGMDWTTTLPAPSLAGDTATYPDVLPGIDLTLQARPQGFEQNLVVAEAPTEPIVVQLPLELKGLSATVDADGQMVMTDSTGKPVIAADPARMWGAEINPANDEPTVQAYVDTRVVNTAAGPKLEIAPDPEFFETPGLTFPVTVDPAPDLAVDKDTYVDSSQPGQFFRNDTYLKTGSPDGSAKTRSYLKFGVGTLAGKYINSATMNLFAAFSASCPNETTVHVFEANSPGIETDTTWNNQPGQGDRYASETFAAGCGGSNGGTVGFDDGGYSGKTMRDLVQKWANNTSVNYGVRMEAQNETPSSGYKKYKSSESSANVPVLSVNYSSFPTAPSGLSVSGANTYQPTLHGTFHDPDGGSGQVLYTITDQASGSAVLTDSAGAMVTSGSNSPLDIPAGTLTDHRTYLWTAKAFDGSAASPSVSGGSFTWDNPPMTPEDPSPLMGYVTSDPSTREISALYLHPGSVNGRVRFQLYSDVSCTSLVASGDGDAVPDGYVSSWIPGSVVQMTLGQSFALKAQAIQNNDGDVSSWTACTPFDSIVSLTEPIPSQDLGAVGTTPTLSVRLEAVAPAATPVTFSVYSYPAMGLVASGTGSTAQPGQRSEWTVPPGNLQTGHVYVWEASGTMAESGGLTKYIPMPAGPSVSIAEPFGSAQVAFEFDVDALASGFDQITKVEFRVDAVKVAEDLDAPYSATVDEPSGIGSHTLSVRAVGIVGGQSVSVDSAPMTVETIADPDFMGSRIAGASTPPSPETLQGVPEAALERPAADVGEGEGPSVRSPLSPFNNRMLDYAAEHWNNYNPNFWRYSEDCANFVSQILRAGGWKFVHPYEDKLSAENWWYKQRPGTANDEASFTWKISESLRHSFMYGGLDRATRMRTGRWRASLENAKVGDVVFVDWDKYDGANNTDEPESYHTLFVTAVRDSNVYVTYHTSDIRNRPMFSVSPGDFRYATYHDEHFLALHPPATIARIWVYATANPKGAP